MLAHASLVPKATQPTHCLAPTTFQKKCASGLHKASQVSGVRLVVGI